MEEGQPLVDRLDYASFAMAVVTLLVSVSTLIFFPCMTRNMDKWIDDAVKSLGWKIDRNNLSVVATSSRDIDLPGIGEVVQKFERYGHCRILISQPSWHLQYSIFNLRARYRQIAAIARGHFFYWSLRRPHVVLLDMVVRIPLAVLTVNWGTEQARAEVVHTFLSSHSY